METGTRLSKKVTFVTVGDRRASRALRSAQGACGAFQIHEWRPGARHSLGEPLLFFIGSEPGNAKHGKNDVKEQIVVQLRGGRGCKLIDGVDP